MKIANKMKFLASIVSISLAAFSLLFTSQAYAATSPDLGAADSFSVLGATTVTNTGSSIIAGDLGVSPGSAVTGFPPGSVTPPYTIHTADESAALAQLANTAAYLALSAGDNADANCLPGYTFGLGTKALVGESLPPGVYCADAFTLTGTLTLTGSGVWVFRSGSSLITSGTANIVGGDPCNVWWKLVSSATLGSGTSLIGNILASTSITMATGANLNGRALAQTGAVTLDTNTISGPICAAAPPTTPTPTPTVETTPAPTSSGPTPTPEGDHLSDNRSDNRSDGRSSTPQPSAVLGASTSTLAATGSSEQSVKIILAVTSALSVFLLGKVLLRANKTS